MLPFPKTLDRIPPHLTQLSVIFFLSISSYIFLILKFSEPMYILQLSEGKIKVTDDLSSSDKPFSDTSVTTGLLERYRALYVKYPLITELYILPYVYYTDRLRNTFRIKLFSRHTANEKIENISLRQQKLCYNYRTLIYRTLSRLCYCLNTNFIFWVCRNARSGANLVSSNLFGVTLSVLNLDRPHICICIFPIWCFSLTDDAFVTRS